jgi:ADP-ribose pyrophosphatase YjhB (NUDIX family)
MTNKVKAYGIALYIKQKNTIKILLCKSVNSKRKWGFLKGVEISKDNNPKQTAKREFEEESSIPIDKDVFEKYFYQINKNKDIGIYLVNGTNLNYINKYFKDDSLLKKYINEENEKVQFFDIDKLPPIKKKQKKILPQILKYLENIG